MEMFKMQDFINLIKKKQKNMLKIRLKKIVLKTNNRLWIWLNS